MDSLIRNNHDVITLAHRNLPQDVWDYICGAAESETTMRRNRLSLDCLAFQPKCLVDVSKLDYSTNVLGFPLRMPVMLAPMGGIQNMAKGGAVVPDSAAEEAGVVNFISSLTQPDLEETAANSPHPKIFQLYMRGDASWMKEIVGRVRKAGYAALALTVDSAYYGNRERLSPAALAARRTADREHQKRLTWDTVKRLQDELQGLPLLLKGVVRPDDAARAVEEGVQGVYISNHGGRQLDHGIGTVDAVPQIAAAVDGKAAVIVDGGFMRGTDVIKAIALGADAVAIGRLQAFALGAGGKEGLVRCLEILAWEIETAMGLLGVNRLDELDSSFVTKTIPIVMAHEMSAFPHLPGSGRIV